MNNILKAAVRVATVKYANNAVFQARIPANFLVNTGKQQLTRSLWQVCCVNLDSKPESKLLKANKLYNCECCSQNIHTKGEKELADFLNEEIAIERKFKKVQTIPTKINNFVVRLNGSDVKLTKIEGEETVTVAFNINHSLDNEEPEINENMDKPSIEIKSKPNFDVEIKKGDTTLRFRCSFQADNQGDLFSIEEVSLYDGELSKQNYEIFGHILNTYLYELLLTILEEKGVSNEFVEKLSNLSTTYEHSCYLALLENLQKFISSK